MRPALLLLLLPLLLLTACGPRPTCPLTVMPWQSLWLDSSDWLTAHPGETLTVCLNGDCRSTTISPIRLFTPIPSYPPPNMTLIVTDASGLHATRDFVPTRNYTSDRCGDHSWYETPARLTADGRLVDH
jgi:hypothetical protein